MSRSHKWIGLSIAFFTSLSLGAQSQADMFRRVGVIGDSLSQGFFGATVEKKTQDWSYPVLVAKQAGASVTYNELKGPFINLEDVLKGDCGPICIGSSIIGGNERTYSLPTHAGITGAEYTSVLRTSGRCEDITARKMVKDWYWKNWYTYTYRWVEVADCQEPDKFHRFGLRDSGTQMEVMEKVKPSFVFGTAGANHVLCTALHTSLSCLDEPRFKRDIREVFRRMANIGSVRGGVLFTIPNVTAIAYLEPYRDPSNRANFTGLKAFYRNSVSSPDQVLDASEISTITNFLTMLNNEIKAQAAANRYAIADLKVIFDDLKENGRPIRHSSGWTPGNAQANWPLPGKPGVFGLDGVHPNMYGHAVFANELIDAINTRYGYSIPRVSEYNAWFHDSLNRNPVDLKKFLTQSIFGQFISWVIGIFT
jgi:lysophospholipase L1-like esterase